MIPPSVDAGRGARHSATDLATEPWGARVRLGTLLIHGVPEQDVACTLGVACTLRLQLRVPLNTLLI